MPSFASGVSAALGTLSFQGFWASLAEDKQFGLVKSRSTHESCFALAFQTRPVQLSARRCLFLSFLFWKGVRPQKQQEESSASSATGLQRPLGPGQEAPLR